MALSPTTRCKSNWPHGEHYFAAPSVFEPEMLKQWHCPGFDPVLAGYDPVLNTVGVERLEMEQRAHSQTRKRSNQLMVDIYRLLADMEVEDASALGYDGVKARLRVIVEKAAKA